MTVVCPLRCGDRSQRPEERKQHCRLELSQGGLKSEDLINPLELMLRASASISRLSAKANDTFY